MSRFKTIQPASRFAELDGLRALAVVSVILFHCEVSGLLSAGFFGVDMFFMISGFIITARLLHEVREEGDFRFSTFYFRRLKRLLPPVAGLIIAAGLLMPTEHGAFDQFRKDVPAALAYLSNWWQIYHEQPYFDPAPLVLKHLWSLAVEEQFYFVWPALAWFALKRFGERSAALLAVLLALASTALMWSLYYPEIDGAGQNRLYLGSDTHAMGLFAGAALAGFWNPWAAAERGALARWFWRCASLAALAVLGWMMQTMNPNDPAIYQGGFLLVPVLSCVVAYATMGDRGFLLSWLLRTSVMQWLGGRSYSLYLVHWLVFSWMRLKGWDDFADPLVLGGGLLIVLFSAELLYQLTEAPFRKLDTSGLGAQGMARTVLVYTGAALLLLAATTLYGERSAPAVAEAGQEAAPADAPAALPAASVPAAVAPGAAIGPAPLPDDDPNEKISGGDDLFAIGDSVLKGSQKHLEKVIPGIRIDAAVGRQASQGLKVVKEWRAAGGKASTVLVHLGTNGYIKEEQYRALLQDLSDRERVILVNVHVPKPWMKPNNEIIARMPADFPNVRVIDWSSLSAGHAEFFNPDNTHLTTRGIRALTARIKNASGGTVLPPAAEQDTMLVKSKEKGGKAGAEAARDPAAAAPKAAAPEPAAAAAPDASGAATAAAPAGAAAPAHKDAGAHPAPAAGAPAAETPPASHEAGVKAPEHPAQHVAAPLPASVPAPAPPVD